MKFQKTFIWMVLILTIIFSSSCMQLSSVVGTQPTPTSPLTNTIPTIIQQSTDSPIPTLLSMPILSSTPAITTTAIPTLPVDEARVKLLELLVSNGECHLPCVWGITPGKTTLQEAQTILIPLSSVSSPVYLNSSGLGGISPSFIEGNLEIYTSLRFLTYPDTAILNRLSLSMKFWRNTADGYLEIFDSNFFSDRVKDYMLPSILSEQGIPSAVLISTLAEPSTRGGRDGFYLLLFYPDQGILAHYTTQWQQESENILGCFSDAHVELELFPSGNGDTFSELLIPTKWANMWPVPIDSPYWKSIENATSMSLDEFYQTFRYPTDQCLVTPADLWPVSEE